MLLLLVALVFAPLSPVFANVIEVPTDYPTIQEAVDNAQEDDQIVILPGTYFENVVIYARSFLFIRSSGGAASTIVDGSAANPVFYVAYSWTIVIEELTVRRGTVGVQVENSDLVGMSGNIIEDNIGTGDGGGIWVARSTNITIDNNEIADNAANANAGLDGGGIFFYGTSGVITANRILRNRAHEGGGLIINQPTVSLLVSGNLFIDNEAVYGGGIYVNEGTHPEIRNNTVVGNSAELSGGGIWYSASEPAILRNIIASNTAADGGGVHSFSPGSNPTFSCNDTWGNTGGNYTGYQSDPTGVDGNLSLDPQFCAAGLGDYRLSQSSPCAAANSPPGCALIGALDVGCGPTALEPSTWGMIKSRYASAKQPRQ